MSTAGNWIRQRRLRWGNISIAVGSLAPLFSQVFQKLVVVGLVRVTVHFELLNGCIGLFCITLQLLQDRLPLQLQERNVEELVQYLQAKAVAHRRFGITHIIISFAKKFRNVPFVSFKKQRLLDTYPESDSM